MKGVLYFMSENAQIFSPIVERYNLSLVMETADFPYELIFKNHADFRYIKVSL